MEIQFLHENFTEKDSKLLMDHIQRMGSGEAPFFSTTLSLVYDKLVEKAFPKHTSPGLGLGCQSVATPTPPVQASPSTPGIASSSNLQAPAPVPEPISSEATIKRVEYYQCVRCHGAVSEYDLRNSLHCPRCSGTGRNGRGKRRWSFMQVTT